MSKAKSSLSKIEVTEKLKTVVTKVALLINLPGGCAFVFCFNSLPPRPPPPHFLCQCRIRTKFKTERVVRKDYKQVNHWNVLCPPDCQPLLIPYKCLLVCLANVHEELMVCCL